MFNQGAYRYSNIPRPKTLQPHASLPSPFPPSGPDTAVPACPPPPHLTPRRGAPPGPPSHWEQLASRRLWGCPASPPLLPSCYCPGLSPSPALMVPRALRRLPGSRPVPSLRFPLGTVPSQAPGPSHASWLLALLQARPQSCPRPWSWGGTSVSNVTAASWVTGERGLRAVPPAAPTRGGQRRDSACRPGCCREERRPPLTLASRGPRGRRGRGRPRGSSRLPASGLP